MSPQAAQDRPMQETNPEKDADPATEREGDSRTEDITTGTEDRPEAQGHARRDLKEGLQSRESRESLLKTV